MTESLSKRKKQFYPSKVRNSGVSKISLTIFRFLQNCFLNVFRKPFMNSRSKMGETHTFPSTHAQINSAGTWGIQKKKKKEFPPFSTKSPARYALILEENGTNVDYI